MKARFARSVGAIGLAAELEFSSQTVTCRIPHKSPNNQPGITIRKDVVKPVRTLSKTPISLSTTAFARSRQFASQQSV
jgi:hypothetical protein